MMQNYHDAHHLARAFIPFQELGELYAPVCALVHGTAFPELHQPYEREYAEHGHCKE